MRLLFRPLPAWTGVVTPAWERRVPTFDTPWPQVEDLLAREVGALGHVGRGDPEVVLQVDADESEMRRDGGIRANARVRSPGAVVSFDSKHGPLTYACDRFLGNGPGAGTRMRPWQCNVYAIARGLEALRKVDRYGIAQSGEQYRGWAALPSGGDPKDGPLTVESAALLIERVGGLDRGWSAAILATSIHGERRRALLDLGYREAAKNAHPDAGGDPALFRRVTAARDLLRGT